MNSIIADNTVRSLHAYMSAELSALYDERESKNIIAEIFRHFKNWSRTDVVMNADSRISESEMLKFHFAVKRIKSGEPLQYVLGVAWFYGLQFEVTNAVLIPRPETEELVRLLVQKNQMHAPRILDIGTGSGCIAVTLKKEVPGAEIFACDISEEALAIASKNATLNNADIHFSRIDIINEEPQNGPWDIIVSNPPYVPESDKAMMRSQVLEHEPHTALFVRNADALVFYKRIIELSRTQLGTGGLVACEIHEDKQEQLTNELTKAGIRDFEFLEDMQGKCRMMFFTK